MFAPRTRSDKVNDMTVRISSTKLNNNCTCLCNKYTPADDLQVYTSTE